MRASTFGKENFHLFSRFEVENLFFGEKTEIFSRKPGQTGSGFRVTLQEKSISHSLRTMSNDGCRDKTKKLQEKTFFFVIIDFKNAFSSSKMWGKT